MFELFLLVLFLGIIFSFGWYFVRVVLGERKITHLFAIGPFLGLVFYIFILNFTSRVIPIVINFYVTLGLFGITAVILFLVSRRQSEKVEINLDKKWCWIVGVTVVIISLWSGLVAMRGLFYDTIGTYHLPTAATVAEGNFPIRDLEAPGELLKYHFASEIFTASAHRVSGIPIWRAYDAEIIISVFAIFMLLFVLAKYLSGNNFIAYLAALGGVYGGGLNYLSIFDGIYRAYQKFFLKIDVPDFFSFVPRIINGEIVDPVIGTVNHHWTALGFPVLIAVIFLYLLLISGTQKNRGALIAVGAIFFGFLPLTAETFFGVAAIALVAYPFFLFFKNRGFGGEVKRAIFISAIFLAVGIFFAFVNGGVDIWFNGKGIVRSEFILFGKSLNIVPIGNGPSGALAPGAPMIKVLSWKFLKNFGLPLIFFIPALVYLRKRVKSILLFAFLAAGAAAVPIFSYYDFPHELLRFFFLAMLFFNLIFAFYLGYLLTENKSDKLIKLVAYILLFLFLLPGLIFEVAYTIVPLKKIEPIPHEFYYVKDYFSKERKYTHEFFSKIPLPSEADRTAFGWIKKNTTIRDIFFYPIAKPVYHDTIIDFNKIKFAVYAGRISPDYNYGGDEVALLAPAGQHRFNLASHTCALDLLRDLGFNYMYASPLWPVGLEEKCLAGGGITRVYEWVSGGDFRRIYKITR